MSLLSAYEQQPHEPEVSKSYYRETIKEVRDEAFSKSLRECVLTRRSIRVYTDQDVDETLLRECVALAQHAPSNSNIQNWRLHLARGAARERIVTALMAAARECGPRIGPVPDEFQHHRFEIGCKLYGKEGFNIDRNDREARTEKTLRNYEFFGAPVCGVVTMSKDLSHMDAMSVGMFVQTFVLALTERGLGTCWQESVTGYPEVLRREFKIPDDQRILCGLAIGYPAKHPVNEFQLGRDDIDTQMIMHRE